VALKLIRAGMYDETVVQRFQAERQSLAIMEHPAIAKVFDAGATPQGQPYFVMEYVPGLPITEYCDQKKLKIRERLELFIQACEGVQHAHQKAIIHRDLKPANILVIEVDGKPVPRIIDFGLAKATVRPTEPSDQTMLTRFGHFMGTPGYMSPEQVSPDIRDIDTRTDVYSLGVILYVLLTGLQPFESKRRQRPPLDEWLRQLREEEPPSPSTKVNSERETSGATAEARGTEPTQLVRLLRGDLDWITMKALERDRERRYAAPLELAADLRRYLNDEPVTARPASAGYQIRKYISRHRVAAAVTTGLLLLMTAFSIVQAIQLQKITRERDRADRITEFMTNMFKMSDPSEARGNSVTAREILDKASTEVDTGLAKDPETQAQLAHVIGNVYESLGLYARAQPLLERAVDTQRRILGPMKPETLRSMVDLAWTLQEEGRYAEAEKLGREALDSERRVLGPEHPNTLLTINTLAGTLSREGRYAETEKLLRELLDIQRRVLGPEHPNTAISVYNLGCMAALQGRRDEAFSLLREAVDHGLRASTDLGIEKDPDLNSLHGDPRFAALVAHAKEKAAATQKPN